jgi:PAS domain S-box-containing protein
MKNNNFDLNTLGEDPILIKNTLKTALDSNFSSVMLTSADAGYPTLYVNPAFTALTGYSYDEVVGKDPRILQGPKTDRKLLGQLRERLNSGNVFHGKTVNYRKDGSEFIMEWKIFPINNSENRTTYFLAVQRAV